MQLLRAEFRYLIEPAQIAGQRLLRGDSFKVGSSGIRCTVEMVAADSVELRVLRPDGKSEGLVLKR